MNPLALLRQIRWSTLWALFGPFLILLFVIGLFGALLGEFERETFFSGYNVRMILTQTVIVAIAALGMTMIIVSGGIDLSVGSVIALTSVVAALLIQQEYGLGSVALAAVLTGGLVGLVNGSIIARFGMAPFIVTLGMLGIARGTAKWLAQNETVNVHGSSVDKLMSGLEHDSWALPPGVIIAISLALLMVLVMRYSVFGRYVFAIGSNEATARLCGIRTRLVKMGIYGFAGLFFGLSGLMQLSRGRQGDPTAALGLELDVIAAVVIGGASLSGGTGSILGSMIGALTMAVLRAGSQFKDWHNYVQEIIIGAVIILAVGLDRLRQRKASSLGK